MEDLRKSFDELKLKLPKDFAGPVEETVEKMFALTQEVESGVAAALEWLAKKNAFIAGIENRMKRRIAESEWAVKEDETRGYLEMCLSHENPFIRLAAAMSYLKYCLLGKFRDVEDASRSVSDLEERKLLVQAHDGFTIGYKKYRLGEGFEFDPQDAEVIEEQAKKFTRQLMSLEKQRRGAVTDEMKQDANLNMEDVWDNEKTGRCFMEVPPEWDEDNERWRRGGQMVVLLTQKDVIPVSGNGAMEPTIRRMKELDIHLQRHTLLWDAPPGSGKAFHRVKESVMRTRDLTEEEASEYVNKLRLFWYLIDRAFKGEEAKEKLEQTRQEFLSRAGITPEQFFGLNGSDTPADGIACLEFEGAFHTKGKQPIYSLFFLIERSKVDGRSVLSLVDMPPHVAELLGNLQGKQLSEGEDFREVPNTLGKILRAIQGQKNMEVEINNA